MLDAMNQTNTPRASPDSSWLLKARGEKSQRNAPSLLWCAHSAHELQGHWANHHHKNIISMPLTCDSTLHCSALLICLSSPLWFSSLWETLYQYWAFWVINLPGFLPFILARVSITSWTHPTSPFMAACRSMFWWTTQDCELSPSLCDFYYVLLWYAGTRMDMTILWLRTGTREGRVWIRTPQGIANTAGLSIRKANAKNWKRKGIFCCFIGLHCSLKFSQPPSQMHPGLHLGKGRDSALVSKVRVLSYMQYALFVLNHKVRLGVNLDEGLQVHLRNTCFSGDLTTPYLACWILLLSQCLQNRAL